MPIDITIPEGQGGVRFPIETKSPHEKTRVIITASTGQVSRSATVMIYPLLDGITIQQPKVKGGSSVSATISLIAPAPPGGATVKLTSANAAAIVPSSVTVPLEPETLPSTLKPRQ